MRSKAASPAETCPDLSPSVSSGDEDPYRYGWRYVERIQEDGTVCVDQVPLTLEDVLHPELEDFIVHTTAHDRDLDYVGDVFKARVADDEHAVVLRDCRVALGVPGVRPHGPDITLIYGVRQQKQVWKTFDVIEEGVLPYLIVEVTSRDTRSTDLTTKVDHYWRAGVPLYIIADANDDAVDGRTVKLLVYRHGTQGYELQPLERGRYWLERVGLWVGVAEGQLALYEADGSLVPDYTGQVRARTKAERARTKAERARTKAEQRSQRVEQEKAEAEHARTEAERRSRKAEKARLEAEQRARAAEDRLRALEEELRRLRGSNVETSDG